jgi:hypothetical protein
MTRAILTMTILAACAASPAPRPTATPASITELAGRRAQMLQWLHEYTEAGVYPTDERGMPMSVFRDARGVLCPMAALIARSGHADLVDAVARTNNRLRLADVHDGPLYDWMLSSGLTRDEIIMVQGAMLPEEQMTRELSYAPALAQAGARGEVRGRLQTAEIALRDHMADGVQAAATARVTANRAPRVVARTTPASPRTTETTH